MIQTLTSLYHYVNIVLSERQALLMDPQLHEKISVYLRNQLAQADKRLKAYTIDRQGKDYFERSAGLVLRKYLRNYTQYGNEPRWIAVPGLRGVGKTTLLAQLYTKFRCGPNRKLYISLDEARSVLGINLVDILTVYEEILGTVFENLQEPIYIFIDEVQYEENWGLVLKSLYDRSNKVFIFCTGSSALSIQTNPDISRRVVFEKLYPMSFTEYILIKDRKTPITGLGGLIREALLNSETAEQLFISLQKLQNSVNSYWGSIDRLEIDKYLKYGTLPFTLQYTQETLIYEQIEKTLANIVTKDIPQLGKFDQTTISRMTQILYTIASSDITSLQSLTKTLNMSITTLAEILDVFEKSEVLLRVYPDGSLFGQVKKPSKYLFLAPAYRSMFFNLIGSITTYGNYKGKLLEDAVGLYLSRILGLRFGSALTYDIVPNGADFIITLNTVKNKRIPIEVGFGDKTFAQVKQTMVKIKGTYGLSVSTSRLALNQDKDIVSVPLSFFLLT